MDKTRKNGAPGAPTEFYLPFWLAFRFLPAAMHNPRVTLKHIEFISLLAKGCKKFINV